MTQSVAGDLTVEYSDGSAKRLHLSRDDAGDLVAEELDGVEEAAPAPAADAGSTEAAPESKGMFADVFGSVEGP
jgi:hypothetical protein